MNVSEYFTKLKSLWDELSAHLRLSVCSCAKELKLNNHIEQKRCTTFLMGFDSSQFEVVKSKINSVKIGKITGQFQPDSKRFGTNRGPYRTWKGIIVTY